MTDSPPLPVTIIGGYLGAGKTTLVNQLLRNANGQKLAVLVNEFGALPIDEDLIEAQDDSLISIAGGCVCCSYGNDLIQAMLDLSKLEHVPDHILIESSGVAMPGAIASSVSIIDNFEVEGIVILVDAETIRDLAANDYMGDTIERQLADANIVLLNKCDLVDQKQLDELEIWLGTKASNATVVRVRYAKLPNSVVLQAYDRKGATPATDFHPHAEAFETRVFQFGKECDANSVAQRLADPEFKLIRAKGFLPTPEGMRAIHIVGRRWAVSNAPPGATSGVVVIAEKRSSRIAALARVFEDQ